MALTHSPVLATITPHGPFSLAEATDFLGGFAPAGRSDLARSRTMRLAFPVEGEWEAAGAVVRSAPGGSVAVEVTGPAPPERVVAQVERILSLDVDGSGLAEVAARDPVVGRLVGRYPGLRPVCWASPYEAAAWAVLSQRIRIVQAAAIRRRLAAEHGTAVEVAGERLQAFPAPAQLIAVASTLGLPEVKAARLVAVAEAALAGKLDAPALRALPAEEAIARLREIPGVGPFSAELVLVRGAGHPDLFASSERRLHAEMASAYRLQEPTVDELVKIADGWRPYRSWVGVLLRTDRERRLGETSSRS